MFGQRGQIVGVMIHIMSVSGLGGTPMSAAVVRYDAITMLEKEQHVGVPIISRQRPAVAKHDGLPFAPVLVIDLCSVFGGDGCHGNAPSILVSDFCAALAGTRASFVLAISIASSPWSGRRFCRAWNHR